MHKPLPLSSLAKTWVFDLDGTLVKHNGYKIDGDDTLLAGVQEFFASLPAEDYVLILTARSAAFKEQTIDFLTRHHIRFNEILFDLPYGERLLINDTKPSGLQTAYAINIERNQFKAISYEVDETL